MKILHLKLIFFLKIKLLEQVSIIRYQITSQIKQKEDKLALQNLT